jgi:hypothetical protein
MVLGRQALSNVMIRKGGVVGVEKSALVIEPSDYDDDTEYINAIPGAAERLISSMNAPASEFSPVPREWFDV